MTNYTQLSRKPKQFHALTGYTLAEFDALMPAFVISFLAYVQAYTLRGKKRHKRRYVTYKNSPLPTMQDKLLFILMYLRKATTQDIFGEVFGMSQPAVNQWIHLLHPCLNQALAELGEIPARTASELQVADDELKIYFQDGTERPIQRPKNQEVQKTYYSGKKKRHTVKNNVLANAQAKIAWLSETCEGKKHDKKIADESSLTLPQDSRLYLSGHRLSRLRAARRDHPPAQKETAWRSTDRRREGTQSRDRSRSHPRGTYHRRRETLSDC
jgi:hypothetical protein